MRLVDHLLVPVNRTRLVFTYRWIMVSSVVLIASLSEALVDGARWSVVCPIAASLVMTFALIHSNAGALLTLIEVVAGVAVVSLSGGPESPFLAYLTVPLVHAALVGSARDLMVTLGVVLVGLVVATSVAGGFGQFHLAIISESALLVALPSLLWIVHAQAATSLPRSTLPLNADDAELLSLLATGMTQSAIADELHVSVETVKARVARLYRRLGARNKLEAISAGRAIDPSDGAGAGR